MGRVKQATLFKEVKKDCGMSQDMMHRDMDGCCDDELVLEIIEDAQLQVASEKAPATHYFLLSAIAFTLITDILENPERDVEVNDSGPPDIIEPERYILFQNLKIPSALQS